MGGERALHGKGKGQTVKQLRQQAASLQVDLPLSRCVKQHIQDETQHLYLVDVGGFFSLLLAVEEVLNPHDQPGFRRGVERGPGPERLGTDGICVGVHATMATQHMVAPRIRLLHCCLELGVGCRAAVDAAAGQLLVSGPLTGVCGVYPWSCHACRVGSAGELHVLLHVL